MQSAGAEKKRKKALLLAHHEVEATAGFFLMGFREGDCKKRARDASFLF